MKALQPESVHCSLKSTSGNGLSYPNANPHACENTVGIRCCPPKMCLHAQTSSLHRCHPIHSAGAEGTCPQKNINYKNNRRSELPELRGERWSDLGLFAPVSTTGILGLIIQMWMLLLENTRSREEALSSTVDPKAELRSVRHEPGHTHTHTHTHQCRRRHGVVFK
ncbi:hypothetical protein EYF80_006189 [Liparis tanakae]|uniref:Uncharacterized protein n=1 Tax=Liparis tanakae TaxID=230148 RepID=A0A4Z2J147_9TELE|nr:hypothetical protein EYF80_006189 [Liparis tanakae]